MRITLSILSLLFIANTLSFAEGTKQLAPNGSIMINGMPTNDIAALYIDNPRFGSFASYNNPNALSRLHINIQDPSNECIFLGFSQGELNGGTAVSFEYRILDPNGTVVFGPMIVDPIDANIPGWQLGFNGPAALAGATGYNQWEVPSADLMSGGWNTSGDYYIEFMNLGGTDLVINYWDISVVNCAGPTPQEKLGRLWSNNWSLFAINDFGFPNRPFNGQFFVCSPDPSNPNASFVTKVDFNESGFRPGGFNVAFNSFGVNNSGNISEDRKSVENENATLPEYAIFLNDPVDICETGDIGEIELIGLSRCAISDFCIQFITSKEGQIDLLLDFDGPDGVYTPGTADVLITTIVTANEVNKATCLDWDGKDGLGVPVVEDASTQIPIVLSYAQGIYHFPIYDAELLTDGLNLTSVRPAGPQPLLYYDDSNITTASGTTEPDVQLAGCNLPCHKWTTYIDANIMGFGNLNTINSWWFSQQLLTEAVFLLPGYYTCSTGGVEELCPGDTGKVYVNTLLLPAGAEEHKIIGNSWTGPSIVGAIGMGDTIIVTAPGTYGVTISWVTATGDTCMTSCEYEVAIGKETSFTIDTLILNGDTIDFNGEKYSESGQYIQKLTSTVSCDTILIINVVVQQTIIHYDLDDCLSVPSKDSQKDYSEFEADYPNPLTCADITAGYLHRENPDTNTHSCTPGVNGSIAMCVSSYDSCLYDPGNEKSVVIEITLEPAPDTAVAITSFTFYEKGPEMFDWVGGLSGPNNYPTQYAFRVLKDGAEIFRAEDVPTSRTWSQQIYTFHGNSDFSTDVMATYRFELLGYCRVGDTSQVSAWDLDELSINASCVSPNSIAPIVAGKVFTLQGEKFEDADIFIANHPSFQNQLWVNTNAEGEFAFNALTANTSYMLRGSSEQDIMNGVTTKDLILIMRHLLGQKEFTSAYQYLAADVNKTRTVSMADIALLRKLILGKIDKFDNNTSWRMGDYFQELKIGNPWDFDQPKKVLAYKEDLLENHLLAIKVGDVSGDATLNGISGGQKTRGTESFNIRLNKNQNRIEFKADEAIDFAGLQMALDLKEADLIKIKSGLIGLEDQHIHYAGNKLFISYNSENKLTLEKNDVLFSIIVEGDSDASVTLDLSNMASEVYDQNLESRTVNLLRENRTTEDKVSLTVSPNPFKESTTLSFNVEKSGIINLSFYSLQGQLIHEIISTVLAGPQSIQISKGQLQLNSGLVIAKLTTGDAQITHQLIISN